MNYKLTIQYDGGKYIGWQKQKNPATIQEKIETVLEKILKEQIQVIGSSRTDSGVHAISYIANFIFNDFIDVNELLEKMNFYLPEDIIIKNIEVASERFHARYNTKSKTYIYKIDNSKYSNVFCRKYAWNIGKELDLNKMQEGCKIFQGTHDFKGFTNKAKNKNTIKTVNNLNIEKNNDIITIEINGDSFLLNMVRIIVGTLVEIGLGQRSVNSINEIFMNGDRALSGERAPAKGLYLLKTYY